MTDWVMMGCHRRYLPTLKTDWIRSPAGDQESWGLVHNDPFATVVTWIKGCSVLI